MIGRNERGRQSGGLDNIRFDFRHMGTPLFMKMRASFPHGTAARTSRVLDPFRAGRASGPRE